MIFRDLPPIEENSELAVEKLAMGESIVELFETVESLDDGFESEQSTYTFIDDAFIDDMWLPMDIGAILLKDDTSVKAVSISYDSHSDQPRPQVAIVLYLDNGERITLWKDPSDLRSPDFIATHSDPDHVMSPVDPEDTGLLAASLIFANSDKPDIMMARMLKTSQEVGQSLDPTDAIVSKYAASILDARADSWKKESIVDYTLEDDRNTLRLVRTRYESGDVDRKVEFTQQGTDFYPDRFFIMETTVLKTASGIVYPPSLKYSRGDNSTNTMPDNPKSGSGDDEPHLHDFMNSVIENAKRHINRPVMQVPLERMLSDLEQDEAERRRYDP